MIERAPYPPSTKVFIAGESDAGKSVAAWKYWLEPAPRRLVIDYTGEWNGAADRTASSVGELADCMRSVASSGRWTIVCELSMDVLPELVAWLMPTPHLERSPIIAVRGASMLVDEADIIFAPGDRTEDTRMFWRRCRHIGLTVVATTQRPECVSREIKASLKQAYIMTLLEPDALLYCERLTRVEGLRARLPMWCAEHPHGAVWVDLKKNVARWVTNDGRWSAPESTTRHLLTGAPAEPEPEVEPEPEPEPEPEVIDDGEKPGEGEPAATP